MEDQLNNQLYREAISRWGEESQIVMAIEEMAELTQQLTKVLRGQVSLTKLGEELADVEIMLEQLRVMKPDVARFADDWKHDKLERLRERLDQ